MAAADSTRMMATQNNPCAVYVCLTAYPKRANISAKSKLDVKGPMMFVGAA